MGVKHHFSTQNIHLSEVVYSASWLLLLPWLLWTLIDQICSGGSPQTHSHSTSSKLVFPFIFLQLELHSGLNNTHRTCG